MEEVIFPTNLVLKGLRRLLPLMRYTKYVAAVIAMVTVTDHGGGSAKTSTVIFMHYLRLMEFVGEEPLQRLNNTVKSPEVGFVRLERLKIAVLKVRDVISIGNWSGRVGILGMNAQPMQSVVEHALIMHAWEKV